MVCKVCGIELNDFSEDCLCRFCRACGLLIKALEEWNLKLEALQQIDQR